MGVQTKRIAKSDVWAISFLRRSVDQPQTCYYSFQKLSEIFEKNIISDKRLEFHNSLYAASKRATLEGSSVRWTSWDKHLTEGPSKAAFHYIDRRIIGFTNIRRALQLKKKPKNSWVSTSQIGIIFYSAMLLERKRTLDRFQIRAQ